MKSILFNNDMVKAILDGRKTITRRLFKPQPKSPIVYTFGMWQETVPCANGVRVFPLPYQPGDILYVRETWAMASDILGGTAGPVFAADYSEGELADLKRKHFRWHPSIHMPKEISRIFLQVKNIRAEQLQNITELEAEREGFSRMDHQSADYHFMCFWRTTIPKKEINTYGWDANPWVWVIEFEQIEKPGD